MITFTPDDVAIPAFTLGRAFDLGNSVDDDLGQVQGRSDADLVFVHKHRLRAILHDGTIMGLATEEWYALREYVREYLRGAAEPFTLSWNQTLGNILTSSEEFGGTTDWVPAGVAPPVVTDAVEEGPGGYPNTASRVAWPGGGYNVVRLDSAFISPHVAFGDAVSSAIMVRVVSATGNPTITFGFPGGGPPSKVIPNDGGWYRINGAGLVDANEFVDLAYSGGTALTLAVTRAQVNLGVTLAPYRKTPAPSFTGCRFLASILEAQEAEEDVWDVRLPIRQEVASP